MTRVLTPRQAVADLGVQVRVHGPDSPEANEARRNLAAANLRAAVEREVAKAGPLGPEQLDELAVILRGGAR